MAKNTNLFIGLALGIAAGAAAAYLLSNDETREKIKTNVRKAADTLMDELDKASKKADVNQGSDVGINGK